MKRSFFWFLKLAIFIWVISCSSPSDLDVNKRIEPVDPSKVRVFPIIRDVIIEENGNQTNISGGRNLEITKSEIVVDTIKNPPMIWMQIVLERKDYNEFRRLSFRSINLKLDSFLVTGLPYSFAEKAYKNKCWAKIKIQRGPKNDFDTLIDINRTPNYFEMSVVWNKNLHEILANGYGKIYDRRFTVSRRDTIVFDSVLKVYYDTIWLDNKPIIKKEEHWEVKEIHLVREEVTPYADSLILSFKIRMKY
ncbi:MAG: hypothetical protein ACUVQ1_07625 [Candidatus Kapaibacteriales bacterium]